MTNKDDDYKDITLYQKIRNRFYIELDLIKSQILSNKQLIFWILVITFLISINYNILSIPDNYNQIGGKISDFSNRKQEHQKYVSDLKKKYESGDMSSKDYRKQMNKESKKYIKDMKKDSNKYVKDLKKEKKKDLKEEKKERKQQYKNYRRSIKARKKYYKAKDKMVKNRQGIKEQLAMSRDIYMPSGIVNFTKTYLIRGIMVISVIMFMMGIIIIPIIILAFYSFYNIRSSFMTIRTF